MINAGFVAFCMFSDNGNSVGNIMYRKALDEPLSDAMLSDMIKERESNRIMNEKLMIHKKEKGYSEAYLKKYRKFYPVIGLVGKQKSYDRFLKNARAILSFDASGEVERISCPVFVIGGSVDKTVGIQASYTLHEKIKGSELYVYEGIPAA